MAIVRPGGALARRRRPRRRGSRVTWSEIVATFSQLARQSRHINQRSGVSVRLSVSPTTRRWSANAVRRALRARRDARSSPASATSRRWPPRRPARSRSRASRRAATARSSSNLLKARGAHRVQGSGSAPSGSARSSRPSTRAVVATPARTCPSADEAALLGDVAGRARAGGGAHRGRRVARRRWPAPIEFVLEGLHLSKRLNKDAVGGRATFRDAADPAGGQVIGAVRMASARASALSGLALRSRSNRPQGTEKPATPS